MQSICDLADDYKLSVIEDCAQAHGAELLVNGNWKSVGTFGDVSAWSFCQDKIISTGGEGGMVTTNSTKHWETIWSLKDHGKSIVARKPVSPAQGGRRDFRWLHDTWYHFRMTEIQAAIGIEQLTKLSDWSAIRSNNSKILTDILSPIDSILFRMLLYIRHAWYRYYIFVRPDNLADGWSRSRILDELSQAGIMTGSGSCGEIYLEKCFKNLSYSSSDFPVAHHLGKTSIVIPVHPTIDPSLMHEIAETVGNICRSAVR